MKTKDREEKTRNKEQRQKAPAGLLKKPQQCHSEEQNDEKPQKKPLKARFFASLRMTFRANTASSTAPLSLYFPVYFPGRDFLNNINLNK